MSPAHQPKIRLCCMSGAANDAAVQELPFSIGRDGANCFAIHDRSISKFHARIENSEEGIVLVDCKSTNGTFVNGEKIVAPTKIANHDLIQIAHLVFRLEISEPNGNLTENQTLESDASDEALAVLQFERLLSEDLAEPYYQPIVNIADKSVFGYEVLARSSLYGLQNPAEMFAIAAKLNQESELSERFRERGAQGGKKLGEHFWLFLNSHPSEMGSPAFFDSLYKLREDNPTQSLVFEIHEEWSLSNTTISELKKVLTELGIHLALDDFGVGKARLFELTSIQPEYIKFDKQMTNDTEFQNPKKMDLIYSLVEMAQKLGIKTIAEGVETEETHKMVQQLGIDLGQGYLYGHPRPIDRPVEFMETTQRPETYNF